MGKVHKLHGRAREAAEALEKAVVLFEQMPHGRLTLAETYAELGRWEEALTTCEVFLRACPDDTGGLTLQAQALLKLNRLAEAEAIYRRLAVRTPSGMAYFAIACLADTRGDFREATVLCRRAWELDRTDARIPFLLGCCLIEAGEYREAVAVLLEAERLAPGTPEIEQRLQLLARLVQRERDEVRPPAQPLQKGGTGEVTVRGREYNVRHPLPCATHRPAAEDGRGPPLTKN
jgi:Flp pilus assembly protein TadD